MPIGLAQKGDWKSVITRCSKTDETWEWRTEYNGKIGELEFHSLSNVDLGGVGVKVSHMPSFFTDPNQSKKFLASPSNSRTFLDFDGRTGAGKGVLTFRLFSSDAVIKYAAFL